MGQDLVKSVRAKNFEGVSKAINHIKGSSKDLKEVLNSYDLEGQTCLHWAARLGSLDILTILVDNGANIDAPNLKVRATPLMKGILCCLRASYHALSI